MRTGSVRANGVAAQNADLLADLLAEMQAFAVAEHQPAEAGTYFDESRKRHERDRWAKWATAEQPPRRAKK
jgi:hypothetical protein